VEDGELIGRVEGLLGELEGLSDATARDVALETVQAVLELYGSGLERIAEGIGDPQLTTLASDELVEHLLLLHGLHPVSVEQRVSDALEGVRPYLGSHGGDVELVGVADGVAVVRMKGSCEGCPASAMTLKLAIEDAILKAAPDVEKVEAEEEPAVVAEGALPVMQAGPGAPAAAPLLQLEVIKPAQPEPEAEPEPAGAWAAAGGLPQLHPGGVLRKEIVGEPVLFLRLADGTPYAYRPDCPGCEGSLEDGALSSAGMVGAELTCPGCGHRYDVVRAGRCLDAPELHLEPVPLLVDSAGLVRVALQATAVG
jgi:Fe-S cluster biogenesis protein NfuA/nitrite reductase/ring-hydroxylating ferredoxin subunit